MKFVPWSRTSPGRVGTVILAAVACVFTAFTPAAVAATRPLVVISGAAGTTSRGGGLPVAHLGTIPPSVPPANIPPSPNYLQACGPFALDSSLTCTDAIVAAIDSARATEGVPPMRLPSDFDALSPEQQLLVAVDLERADRGLPVFAGEVASLNAAAEGGAAASADPHPPPGFPATSWHSNWAEGEPSALAADYGWMYDDGYDSGNIDCQGTDLRGCWGHRNNILGSYSCSPCVLGAGVVGGSPQYAPASSASVPSRQFALLFVGMTTTPAYSFAWSSVSSRPTLAGKLAQPIVAMASTPDGHGYWLAAADGGIFAFGDAGFFGSAGSTHLSQPVVAMAPTPDGKGYWMMAADGGVYSYGDAGFFGSASGAGFLAASILPTADAAGYWLVATTGGLAAGGDAFNIITGGSATGVNGLPSGAVLNEPMVAAATTSDRNGDWMAASDGGIFAFGDAGFFGSMGGTPLNRPVDGFAATPDSAGYWEVASDGGIFAFGDAGFFGSTGALPLNSPVDGMAPTPDGKGYWLVASDGGIFAFGDAAFFGSTG